jgi:hypothetical protein
LSSFQSGSFVNEFVKVLFLFGDMEEDKENRRFLYLHNNDIRKKYESINVLYGDLNDMEF